MAEFVAYAKANPEQGDHRSAGIGAVTHLAIEVLKREAKIDLIHVPFRSTSESLPQLMGGQIDALFGDGPIIAPQVRGGNIVALAVAAPHARSRAAGGADHGRGRLSRLEAESWFGLVVSSKTRRRVITRLQGAVRHGAEGSGLPGEPRQARRQRRRARAPKLRQADQEGCREMEA